ncbi:MAG: hypothetical protein ACRDFQ_05415 [Anaerolineales bacterium]
MTKLTDILVVPLHRRAGQDQPYLPGVHAMEPPRRTARGRGKDFLILQLTLSSEIELSPEHQASLIKDMAQGYYRNSGAITSALRRQAERMNEYLVQRNQQLAQKGQMGFALLSMLVVRGELVTLAQCGAVHGFLLSSQGIEHFYDPQTSGRGLGLSQNTNIRFHQLTLEKGNQLVLLPELPPGWSEKTLSDVQGEKMTTLRRRFLADAGSDLRAVLVSSQAGDGKLRLLSGAELPAETATRQDAPKAVPQPDSPQAWEEIESPDVAEDVLRPIPISDHPAQVYDLQQNLPVGQQISARLAPLGERLLPPLRSFLLRMLPEEPVFNLPPQTMGLIAALVPLGVVVLVSVIYLQVGRGQLYTNYLAQAQSAAAAAAAREDSEAVRQAWEVTQFYAERAVLYQEDDQAAAQLLAQARQALDEMDAIQRVDFQPALFENLPQSMNLTRIVATNTDLYMLNSTDGKIQHAFLTGGGYQWDEGFHCEPGPYGAFIVSDLIDLALLPRGNPLDAALVAMDANGNLIYCFQDERPLAVALQPPDSNWGNPVSISVEDGNLYVLDPLTNAVWIYFGEEFSFVDEPRFFFGAEVPQMQSMLDLALQEGNLYLLDLDGHMAVCEFSEDLDAPTTCQDPFGFTDSRPGKENGPQIEGAHFSQIQITEPPEPSVYALDPVSQAVYQFSLRLSLVRQFRNVNELPEGVVTAFAVTPNRAIFIAFENEVLIGFMP